MKGCCSCADTNEFRNEIRAHWTLFSDAMRMMQKDLVIAKYTDTAHNPIIPHMLVLEPGLVIYKVFNVYCYFGIFKVEEIGQDLPTVTRKCRPDWDINSPELKAGWKQEHKKRFHP